jgi:hypothetical protein
VADDEARGASARGRTPAWVQEPLLAIAALVAWVLWEAYVGAVASLLALAVRALPSWLWPPFGPILQVAAAGVVCVGPLLVAGKHRFVRWTWFWGLALIGLDSVLNLSVATGVIAPLAKPTVTLGHVFSPWEAAGMSVLQLFLLSGLWHRWRRRQEPVVTARDPQPQSNNGIERTPSALD